MREREWIVIFQQSNDLIKRTLINDVRLFYLFWPYSWMCSMQPQHCTPYVSCHTQRRHISISLSLNTRKCGHTGPHCMVMACSSGATAGRGCNRKVASSIPRLLLLSRCPCPSHLTLTCVSVWHCAWIAECLAVLLNALGWPLVTKKGRYKCRPYLHTFTIGAPMRSAPSTHTVASLPPVPPHVIDDKVWCVNGSGLLSCASWGGESAVLYSVKSLLPQRPCAQLSNHQRFYQLFSGSQCTHTGGTFTARVITVTPCPGVDCVCVCVCACVNMCMCVCECVLSVCECVFLVYVCVLLVQRNTGQVHLCV